MSASTIHAELVCTVLQLPLDFHLRKQTMITCNPPLKACSVVII